MFEHKNLGLTEHAFDMTVHALRNTLYVIGVPWAKFGEFMDIIETYRFAVAAKENAA